MKITIIGVAIGVKMVAALSGDLARDTLGDWAAGKAA